MESQTGSPYLSSVKYESKEEKEIVEKIHHGHNIKRIREALGWKQEHLARQMGLKQSAISVYENQRGIEDKILQKFADVFNIPLEVIKHMEEDPARVMIENIFNDNDNVDIENTGCVDVVSTSVKESVEKVSELYERIIALEKENLELKSKI